MKGRMQFSPKLGSQKLSDGAVLPSEKYVRYCSLSLTDHIAFDNIPFYVYRKSTAKKSKHFIRVDFMAYVLQYTIGISILVAAAALNCA